MYVFLCLKMVGEKGRNM